MYYLPVQKLQGVLFLCSGAAECAIFGQELQVHFPSVMELQVHYFSVMELQGVQFFCSGAAGCAFLLFRSCRCTIFLLSSSRVCYFSVPEMRIVLFFCSGAARCAILCSGAARCATRVWNAVWNSGGRSWGRESERWVLHMVEL